MLEVYFIYSIYLNIYLALIRSFDINIYFYFNRILGPNKHTCVGGQLLLI